MMEGIPNAGTQALVDIGLAGVELARPGCPQHHDGVHLARLVGQRHLDERAIGRVDSVQSVQSGFPAPILLARGHALIIPPSILMRTVLSRKSVRPTDQLPAPRQHH